MITKNLTIIGAGNMGKAIASGLLKTKTISPSRLILTDPFPKGLEQFQKQNVTVTSDNEAAVKKADIILLAVKPQVFPELLPELKKSITQKQLIISIAAGIEIITIKKLLGISQPVVRVMPNLCAMVGESFSAWVKSKEVTKEQEKQVKVILEAIGKEAFLDDEQLLDAVTAISGSGPAYVFYLVELLEKSAVKLGIPEFLATVLASQTVIGSAKFLRESSTPAFELRQNVTSKGGTTEAAFKTFKEEKLSEVFYKGIKAANKRAKELNSN